MPETNKDFCMSSYLTYRYVVKEGIAWKPGVEPKLPRAVPEDKIRVKDAVEVFEVLKGIMQRSVHDGKTGILLSSGVDSAILASMMPPGTPAYTIQFAAEGAVDEVTSAKAIAQTIGLRHRIVNVSWDDYQKSMGPLMKHKNSPLHAAEVGLYQAALRATDDGVQCLVVGNGADSIFGGLDKLLSKDWSFDAFVKRYTFLEPSRVLKKPVVILTEYEKYREGEGINILDFLKMTHGTGIVQMFDNALNAGHCTSLAPYEQLVLAAPLDLNRIRKGESKYVLREVFHKCFPSLEIPEKIAFARPVDVWLENWQGPTRQEFLDPLSMSGFNGEQKWLLYCLEQFLNRLDQASF